MERTSAMDKEEAGDLTWRGPENGGLSPDDEAALRHYFQAPNDDLRRLLADEGQTPMSWL